MTEERNEKPVHQRVVMTDADFNKAMSSRKPVVKDLLILALGLLCLYMFF